MSARAEEAPVRERLAAGSWRIVRGNPTAEEVAALAVVLGTMLSLRAGAQGGTVNGARHGAPWDPPTPVYGAATATSWAAGPRPGWRMAA
ncbi:acyl-CoA carboxylase epsilon subunit [Streptomyces sioyaensis]|uniref:acyl-CoA carboxylase epsilon subunit n=1 Tax=Streptomyces sioyaensis TaxID=67364 RepID=UPI0037B69D7A